MASPWRFRHKLFLGFGLVVAILALLLAGTFKGLWSYLTTTKTMESKLKELEYAHKVQQSVQALVAACKKDDDAVPGDKLAELVDKQKDVWDALEDYKAQLDDTLNRGRDPNHGYELLETYERFKGRRDFLRQEVEAYVKKKSEAVAVGNRAADAEKPERAGIDKALDQVLIDADGLIQHIRTGLDRCIESARKQCSVSVWIVSSTSVTALLLMTGLLRFFYGWVFHPVRDLQKGAERVAQGDFEHRIEVHSGDEMEELAAAFNNMTGRLREMYRDLARQVNERSRQLVRSERLAGVGFLAAGVAHEINNPLASIAFCSEALEARLADALGPLKVHKPKLYTDGPEPAQHDRDVIIKYLKMIQDEAFRCKEITERLLEFSRTGERRREPVPLADLVQSVLDMVQHLQNRKGKQVVFEKAGPVTAWVNAQEIKSVVLNLVVNALDSMEEGGVLTVTLRQQHDMAELTFADTGCGMPADVLENIFEPFFTRSRTGKGTGLGLTITHRIITQHGGEIEAASPGVGAGSTFTVRLPFKPVEAPEPALSHERAA